MITPIPWRIGTPDKLGKTPLLDSQGWPISGPVHKLTDAEFIVRACNAHAKLLALLQAILPFAEDNLRNAPSHPGHCALADARDLLEKLK